MKIDAMRTDQYIRAPKIFSDIRSLIATQTPPRSKPGKLTALTIFTMTIRCQLLSNPCRVLIGAFQSTSRHFSTTPFLQKKVGGDLGSHLPKHVIPKGAVIPEYPYGENRFFKQSNKGLYGGAMIQFGNNVSRDTETKSRRSWHPNVLSKALYSIALKKKIKLRVTAKVLKTIDKEGGLDEYLLGDKESRIKELGPVGWKLRYAVMRTSTVRNRMREEARRLGLPADVIQDRWGKKPRKLIEEVDAEEEYVEDPEVETEQTAEETGAGPSFWTQRARQEFQDIRQI
jgi:large subunit ribosomal protein L28